MSDEVFTDATRLPRELVSARPDRAAARLAQVQVPGDVLAATTWLYYAAGAPVASSRTPDPEPIFARPIGPTDVEIALHADQTDGAMIREQLGGPGQPGVAEP